MPVIIAKRRTRVSLVWRVNETKKKKNTQREHVTLFTDKNKRIIIENK